MKVVIAGGSGFIGKQVIHELIQRKYACVLLTRNPESFKHLWGHTLEPLAWDGKTLGDWVQSLDGADAVINLSGDSIAEGRWTEVKKQRILESRIHTTHALAQAIAQVSHKPKVWINGSAIGYYGAVAEGELTEASSQGHNFLSNVCAEWEAAVNAIPLPGVRKVLLRTGVVLGHGGGALEKMIPPFQFFVGGPLGSGKQWLSWIHIQDMAGMIAYCLGNSKIQGPINATSPHPVRMKDFCRSLGKVLKRPSWAPVPEFVLKILLGQMAEEMLLSGQKVIPEKILEAGYVFRFPDLTPALESILKK